MKTLLLVDLQNDFMPGGAMGVAHADEIIPRINAIIPQFEQVISTQDWHPPDHVSFAVNHPGKKAGDIVTINGIEQILWPVHCVRDTFGAELVNTLKKDAIESKFFKGTDKMIDSYSSFFDNAKLKSTGLSDFLESRNVHEIHIAGMTTDYCVLYSVEDAIDLGFSTTVIVDCCKAINLHSDDEEKALAKMKKMGARLIMSNEMKK